jgi:hypothetical protein
MFYKTYYKIQDYYIMATSYSSTGLLQADFQTLLKEEPHPTPAPCPVVWDCELVFSGSPLLEISSCDVNVGLHLRDCNLVTGNYRQGVLHTPTSELQGIGADAWFSSSLFFTL